MGDRVKIFDDRKGNKLYAWIIKTEFFSDKFKNKCRGFAHGGKFAYLPGVLGSRGLLCSNTLRMNGGYQVRDKAGHELYGGSGTVEGAGVYFRFVKKTENILNDILRTSTGGVGATGGVFYFMPCERALGKFFTTVSAGDMKFGNKNPNASTFDGIIDSITFDTPNKSEIAFKNEVPLDDISIILVDVKKTENCDYAIFNRFYNLIIDENMKNKIKRPEVNMSLWPEGAMVRAVLKQVLLEMGFVCRKELYLYNKKRWMVFVKEGSDIAAPEYPLPPHAPKDPLTPLTSEPPLPPLASEQRKQNNTGKPKQHAESPLPPLASEQRKQNITGEPPQQRAAGTLQARKKPQSIIPKTGTGKSVSRLRKYP